MISKNIDSVLMKSYVLLVVNLLTLIVLLTMVKERGVIDFYLTNLFIVVSVVVVNTALSLVLVEQPFFGFLNAAILILYVNVVSKQSFTSLTIWAPIVASMLTVTLIKKGGFLHGLAFDLKAYRGVWFRGFRINLNDSLGDLALVFAYLSLIYPLVVLTLLWVHVQLQLRVDVKGFVKIHSYFLATNTVLVVFAKVHNLNGKRGVFASSVLTSLSALSAVPLLSYILVGLREALMERSKPFFLSSNLDEAVVFGKTLSRLTYGYVTKPYGKVSESSKPGRKTWYWRVEEGVLAVNPKQLPNKHVLIMGSSGSGKSLLVKHLAIEFYKKFGYNLLIFDPHAEYVVLDKHIPGLVVIDASTTSINPLELGGSNPRERSNQLAHIVSSIFRLGSLQRGALEELFMKAYEQAGIHQDDSSTFRNEPPIIHDALTLCEKLMVSNEVYRRVYPYLKFLADNVFSQTTIDLKEILNQPVVFVLNRLKSDYVKLLYVDTFLHKLLEAMYRNEVGGEHLVVLDEAYVLTSREYERKIVTRLLVESRKYNIGVVFVTQNPLSTPTPIVENAAVKISFNVSEPRNLEYVAKILAGSLDKDKLEMVMRAVRNLNSLNYVLSFSGVEELFMVSERECIDKLIG